MARSTPPPGHPEDTEPQMASVDRPAPCMVAQCDQCLSDGAKSWLVASCVMIIIKESPRETIGSLLCFGW